MIELISVECNAAPAVRKRPAPSPPKTARLEPRILYAVELDLDPLPIPNWDLRCPTCDYILNGLPLHRCPECGTEFNIRSIIPTSAGLRDPRFSGEELPFPDFGLTCAKCGYPLAGTRERRCPSCFEPFDPQVIKPADGWFTIEPWMCQGVPIDVVGAVLDAEYVPYTVHEHRSAVGFAWSSISVARDFIFDLLYVIRQRVSESATPGTGSPADSAEAKPWNCESCSQQNPAHFAVCWNCQTARGG